MTDFNLRIVTPDGVEFEGSASSITVRSTDGNVGILARHTPYVTPLAIGETKVITDGQTRVAACGGGMLSVMPDMVTIVATTFEWAENIDLERANRAKERADRIIGEGAASQKEQKIAELKLKRALARINAAKQV